MGTGNKSRKLYIEWQKKKKKSTGIKNKKEKLWIYMQGKDNWAILWFQIVIKKCICNIYKLLLKCYYICPYTLTLEILAMTLTVILIL